MFTQYFHSGNSLGCRGAILEREDATTQETKYELVLKTIAGLELNDDTPHVHKLQLCIALAKSALDLRPVEQAKCVFGDKLKTPLKNAIRNAISAELSGHFSPKGQVKLIPPKTQK